MGTYLLAPGTSRVEEYPFTGRPVLISSDKGADIIASLYELQRPGTSGRWTVSCR